MPNDLMIPEFTAEQYKYTDEPYKWLYEQRGNKFLLKQITVRMQEQAGALGFRGFVAMWNAYTESMAQREGVTLERVTEFTGQPIELLCAEYICNDSGVSLLDKFGYTNLICRHPIEPVRRLVNVDSGEERLEIAYRKGKVWRSVIIEKSVIASSSQILQLAAFGVMVNSENAKALSTYLFDLEQLNYDRLPEQNSVGRLGWVVAKGFSPYVDDLIFDGETNYKHVFDSVQCKGDFSEWKNAMLKIRAEKSVCRIFLAASFASAILEPCGLLPFFVHAWGGQGTGKTVSLMVAASVWANPRMGEYITTFNSTDVGQEMLASFLNSLPFCMDELQIQAASGVKDFDRTIYKLTEGIGRTRGAKTGGIKKVTTWKNCILTTGEYPIINANSMGGATVRVIEFECAEKVYSDLVGLCAVINENYGFAGKEFVRYLQSPGAFERVNELQKEFFRELLKTDSTDKQAASAAAILAADTVATELFFQDGFALTVNDIASVMASKKEADVNSRALQFVYELVATNPSHFTLNEYGECRIELWGECDTDYIYIVKSIFDREMANGGFNSSSFLSWAKRNGYLISDADRRTKKKRIGGKTAVNTVCLLRDPDKNWVQELDQIEDELPL